MPHWLPLVSGWALAVMGGGLLAWALLGDAIAQRFRRVKKRRCPKCWYDLSHSPGLTCSECGYTAKRERRLFRGRRRWRWAVVAVVILAGAHVARRTPDIRERGWVAAVPTTVLIYQALRMFDDGRLPLVARCRRLGPPPKLTYAQQVSFELDERFAGDELWLWQRRIMTRHSLALVLPPVNFKDVLIRHEAAR